MVFVSAETGRLEASQIKPWAALKRNMSPVIVVLVYGAVRSGRSLTTIHLCHWIPGGIFVAGTLCNRKPVGKLAVTPMAASDTVR